ncbi:MAG: site-specific DNA-methyltransferase [Epsilonproteobacteria bacterium]|nr:MAG: site-specific DNA-methyltransferase [Campylobacterota bacterium]
MAKKQKLELTWIGKDDEVRLEPRVLIENPELSYGDADTENMIIHGDNLLALKALEQDYAGQVKCIYIDPPFNTGNAFEHYDDNMEHSLWLSLMHKRAKILHSLLSSDGVLIVHLDDQEVFYMKVLLDEIFGRDKFITSIAVRSSTPSGLKTTHKNKTIIKQKDIVLVYKKNKDLRINPQYTQRAKWDSHYASFFDRRTKTVRKLVDVLFEEGIVEENTKVKNLDANNKKFKEFYTKHKYSIFQTQPTMPKDIKEKSKNTPDEIIAYIDSEGIENFALNGRRFVFLENSMNILEDGTDDLGILLCDFWSDIDFQNTQNEGGVSFPASKKPEKLLLRIFKLFTSEGDLVMDSFLGSGTTAAAAHKMNRKYIGIELGNHAITHVAPRLNNVIDGKDKAGITDILNWKGGGGFKFYTLAPSLLKKDKFDNWIIEPSYNAELLASALAKQEAFTYYPDSELFWKQGYSTENDFIFTTTQFITVELLDRIHEDMGEDESLLICAKRFQDACVSKYENITLKKIPKVLLGKCEFDKDDYSLNITESEEVEVEDE